MGFLGTQTVAPRSINPWLKSNTCLCGTSASDSIQSRRFIACVFGLPLAMNTRKSTLATLVSRMAARWPKAKLRMAPQVYLPMPLNERSVGSSDGNLPRSVIVFVLSLIVAAGLFALCRLVGRIVLEKHLHRVRRSALGSHLVTSVFLVGVGLAHLQQIDWVMQAYHWVVNLFR